jgi:hypothetical protein
VVRGKKLQPIVRSRRPEAHKTSRDSPDFFTGVCGNNRAAGIYGDDAKSTNPGGLARVSGQKNSLRTAIEFRADDRACCRYRYRWRRHSTWMEQIGQTIETSSFSSF